MSVNFSNEVIDLPFQCFPFFIPLQEFHKGKISVIAIVTMESGRRMKIKAVSGIMLTLLLTSMLTLAFNIQPLFLLLQLNLFHVKNPSTISMSKLVTLLHTSLCHFTIRATNTTVVQQLWKWSLTIMEKTFLKQKLPM